MKINSYRFGEMDIDGTIYTSDLAIVSANIYTRWYRQEGHTVGVSDIEKWITKDCKQLIIGTGAAGCCKVLPEIETYCRKHSIELITLPTERAIEKFNAISDKSKVVAAFHLTC